MPQQTKAIQMAQPQDDPDFLIAIDYLQYVEVERHTINEFAKKHNVTHISVWRWRTGWESRGLLSAAREFMALEMVEDLTIQTRRAVRQWGEVLEEMVSLAKNAKREDVRVTAAQFLWRDFVKPFADAQPDRQSKEKEYLDFIEDAPSALDPMSILRDDLGSYEPKQVQHVENTQHQQHTEDDPESDQDAEAAVE